MADEGNGRIERGRFEGRVLEALEHLKADMVFLRTEVENIKDTDRCDHEKIGQRISDLELKAAKVAGIVATVVAAAAAAIQGVIAWWRA